MSGSAFFISLVVLVQCVHGGTITQSTPLGPDFAPSRIARLKNAFIEAKEQATQIAAGSQCYGQPGTGSSCGSASNGCCGQCSSTAPYCGGTSDDNPYWAGCRTSSNSAGPQYSACSSSAQAMQITAGSQCYGQPGTGSSCGSSANGCCGQCSSTAPYCGGTSDDNQYWAGCRTSSSTAGPQFSACGHSSSSSPPSPSPTTGTAGTTTRYWDCCKASCSWPGKATANAPVSTCVANGVNFADPNAVSGCDGGSAYMCNSNQPATISPTLAFGFAAANIGGESESDWCSACYQLTFTSGPVSGKRMIVQVTNTGGDLGAGHFDLEIPGGGVGIFNGCSSQWGASSTGWGAQYGGVSSASQCSSLPAQLRSGCLWRFDSFFQSADNPTMTFTRVRCNSWFAKMTGSTRSDDVEYAYAAGTNASTAP